MIAILLSFMERGKPDTPDSKNPSYHPICRSRRSPVYLLSPVRRLIRRSLSHLPSIH